MLLDGITDQEELYDGVLLSPSVDAIQEFRVQSNAFSAEYGRGSAIVNLTIKSGTNDFHGTVFEFFRMTNWMPETSSQRRRHAPSTANQLEVRWEGPTERTSCSFSATIKALASVCRRPTT